MAWPAERTGGTDAIELGIAVAEVDVFAVDAVMTKAMGFEPLEIGLFYYGNELGMGVADLEKIKVLETPIEAVRKPFKPHETTDLQLQWQREDARQLMAAD